MESQELFNKYSNGEHWKNNPITYSEKFSKFLKSKRIKNIVDAGCGNGKDTHIFYLNKLNALGIDYSKKEIKLAKKEFPQLKFEVQNIENLKFKNNSIDSFFCINVIHYTKKEKAISEFYRTLKKGGYLFIHFNLEIKDKSGRIDHKDSKKEITKLVSNFKIIKKEIISRKDTLPIEHTHKILELILQK